MSNMEMSPRKPKVKRQQTIAEEIANSITHGIGAGLSIAGLVLLIITAAVWGNAWYVVGFTLFGSSAVILYLSSTLYHAITHKAVKRVLEIMDHSSIFIMISGSYSAFVLTVLRDVGGWWIFGVLWGLTVVGIFLKTVFVSRFKLLSTLIYIGMGWTIIAVFPALMQRVSLSTVVFLVAGGLSYTVGTIFYGIGEKMMWMHSVWHLFVIGGTVCHFFAAMFLLL
ncbi:MAG: PAQR family membrane homeostasis protein TrhA [Spirochaetia bacterium]